MSEDISFNVFHSCGVKVNHVRFTIPWKILSFHNFVGRIIKECDLEIKRFNSRFPSILYINLEGDHVQLNCDEDEYLKFLDFIRQSKERGHEFVHLIIPDFGTERNQSNGIEERGSTHSERNELNLQDLSDLFSVNVDDKKFSRIHKSLRDLSANIWLPQPTSSSSAAYPEATLRKEEISSTHGMLDVKRIHGKDVPWFLANGSRILVPTQDGDYLSVSFSKDCAYAPYKFFSWQNGEGDPGPFEYRCQEMKIPVSVQDNSICISDESKNLITNVVACGQSISQKIQELNQNSTRNDTHLLTKPNVDLEEEIPAWFRRHVKEFKKDLVADLKTDLMNDLKTDLMNDVKEMLLSHDAQLKTGHNTLLMNGKNSFASSREQVPQLDAEKNEEDWDVVNRFSDDEINENSLVKVNRCNRPKENELDSLQATDAECEHELESSNCYDSDSSVSIILDERKIGEGDVSADSASSFIEIPRCFVSQLKDAHPSGAVTVPVRVKKRRTFNVMKSSMSSTKRQAHPVTSLSFKSSSNLLDGEKLSESEGVVVPELKPLPRVENNIETSPGKRKPTAVPEISDSCRPAASPPSPPRKQKEGKNFPGADGSQSKTSASAYAESEPTQPLNILPDKIFEMTNNVFKNVLNSVKIPHSSEVKESVQKVFEESMSAASRLIPNPLLAEALPSSVNSDIPSTSSTAAAVAAAAAAAAAATATAAAAKQNAPSSTSASVSDSRVNFSQWRTNEQDDVLRYQHDLPAEVRMNLTILNEMGFNNNGHNLFLLTQYPDDLEKVVDSLVNFYSPLV